MLAHRPHTSGADLHFFANAFQIQMHSLEIGLYFLCCALINVHPVMSDLIAEYGFLATYNIVHSAP
jgi:hypothetical protein